MRFALRLLPEEIQIFSPRTADLRVRNTPTATSDLPIGLDVQSLKGTVCLLCCSLFGAAAPRSGPPADTRGQFSWSRRSSDLPGRRLHSCFVLHFLLLQMFRPNKHQQHACVRSVTSSYPVKHYLLVKLLAVNFDTSPAVVCCLLWSCSYSRGRGFSDR